MVEVQALNIIICLLTVPSIQSGSLKDLSGTDEEYHRSQIQLSKWTDQTDDDRCFVCISENVKVN